LLFFTNTLLGQVTITATATSAVYYSATGGAFVFGVRNNNNDPITITDFGNYTETGINATYTLWYKSTPVTGTPGAITTANGWTQIAGPYTLTAAQPTGLTAMFSNINFQIPGNTIYRFAIVGEGSNSPYYATANAGPSVFEGGGVEIISQDNAVSPGYGGPITGPANTPRGFLGSITFKPANACSTPIGGTAAVTPASICAGGSVQLSLTGNSFTTGQTYTWQVSPTIAGTYTNIGTSTTTSSLTTTATASGYYRCAISCNGGAPAYSTPILLTVRAVLTANTYTINNTLPTSGLNFASFTDAFNALNCATGKIVFNVSAGQTFTENPPPLEASGTVTDSIIFRKFGSGANPVIVPASAGTLASSATIGTNGDAILTINGGDYITFDGIDLRTNPGFSSGNDAYEYGYYLKKKSGTDACKNVSIKNAVITLNKAIQSFGIHISNNSGTTSAITVTSTDGCSENIKVSGNTILNSYGGILAKGYAASSPYDLYDQNIEIGVGNGNGILDFGGGATAAYGIYTIYQNNIKISNNNITSAPTGQTTTLYGIFTSTATNASGDINDNRVTVTGGGTTAIVYAISSNMGATGTSNRIRIFNNNISNCSYPTATSGSLYLLDIGATAFNMEVYGNSITNNKHTPTTTGAMYCLNQSSAVINQIKIYNNTISNNKKETGTTGAVYLLYNISAAATATNEIYDNVLSGFANTGTTGILYGMYISGGLENRIFRNKIYGLTNTATTGSAYGITLVSGVDNRVYNNFISDINTPTTSSTTEPIRAINISSTTANSTQAISYNTIFLKATSSGTNFSTTGIYHTTSATATTSVLELNNNIIVNISGASGTGYSSVLRRSSATLTNFGSSNNNLYYADNGANHVLFYDGTNSDLNLVAYQARVAPKESASVTENPSFVNVTSVPYDLHINPAIATRAESGAVPIAGIVQDIDAEIRSTSLPDIGADEFVGTAIDGVGPTIAYSAEPASSICFGTKAVSATIADASGVNIATGTKPRLWFKKLSENNMLAATNTAASNGWKWVEPSNTASPFNFNFDFSLLTSPITGGDNIIYFVVAQDVNTTPNIGVNTAIFSSAPTSVALSAAAFPVTGNIKTFSQLAQPNPLVIKSDLTELCLSGTVTLNTNGIDISGSNYKWQSSLHGANNFVDIPNGTTLPFTTGTLTDSTDFRLVVSCNSTPISSSPSPIITVSVNKPQVLTTTPAVQCGPGMVNLAATATSGSILNWYTTATAGTPIGTGSPFTTPSISATTTYYVSATNGGGITSGGRLVPFNTSTGFTGNNYGLVFDALQAFKMKSVDIYPTATAGSITIQLLDGAGTVISTGGPFVIPAGTGTTYGGGATPVTLNLDFNILPGTNYKIQATAHTGNIVRDNPITSTFTYPVPLGSVGNITAGWLSGSPSTGAYYYFYNIIVTSGCESPRVAVTATINNNPGCTVPVKLLSFSGEKKNNFNKLSWSTATETNNSGFELERSTDGIHFSSLVFVASKASNGNSNTLIQYSFDDVKPLMGSNYYRLKQVDKDGKVAYSAIVNLKVDKIDALQIVSIYPNPVKDVLNLKIASPSIQKVTMMVTDAAGRIVAQQPSQLVLGDNQLTVNTSRLAQGNYYVKLVCASGCQALVYTFIKE